MRLAAASLALTAALAVASPAFAQGQADAEPREAAVSGSPRLGPIPASATVGFRAFLDLDQDRLAAAKSFHAVTGKSSVRKLGFGLDVTNIWQGLFARFAVSSKSLTATRVDVTDDGQVFDHHIPGTVALRPLELAAGWRAGLGNQLFVPYAGAGLTLMKYTETWTGGTADDDVAATFTGYSLFGGVDFCVAPHVTLGVEGQYRTVPNAIGAGGVSKTFGETNLGGFTLRLRLGAGW